MSFRTDFDEIDKTRRKVEDLVSTIADGGQHAFNHPWELRAFALAIAAYEIGMYPWTEFQQSLITSIRRSDSPYFEHWLEALETVLADKATFSEEILSERAAGILAIPKDTNHHVAHREPVAIDPAS